jgi:large subunit ribosomal protein L27
MAHKKAASGGVTQGIQVQGKRRGVKIFGGEIVKNGNIIVRQKGTKFFAGKNTAIGRDFTIYALKEGKVKFRNLTGKKQGKKAVDVIPL